MEMCLSNGRGLRMAAEKHFENKIKKFLKDNNAWFVKYFANGYTKVGVPDILACVNGYFLGIEVKASNGKPSPSQIHNLKKIDEAGGYAILLYPDQFDLFKKLVDSLIMGDDYKSFIYYKELKIRWKSEVN